ncbi:MAG: hypothetical protein ACYDD6_09805 [Acidimicrobiales bacterium]
MTARPDHAINTLDAVEAAELMSILVQMCDLAGAPMARPLLRVIGGPGYPLEDLRSDLVRLAKAMNTGIEL